MEDRVKKFIKQNNINIDNKIIVAVSGGSDSIMLIHVLIFKFQWISICH